MASTFAPTALHNPHTASGKFYQAALATLPDGSTYACFNWGAGRPDKDWKYGQVKVVRGTAAFVNSKIDSKTKRGYRILTVPYTGAIPGRVASAIISLTLGSGSLPTADWAVPAHVAAAAHAAAPLLAGWGGAILVTFNAPVEEDAPAGAAGDADYLSTKTFTLISTKMLGHHPGEGFWVGDDVLCVATPSGVRVRTVAQQFASLAWAAEYVSEATAFTADGAAPVTYPAKVSTR